jgi:CDP-paratose 2-epimerase
MSTNKVYGDAPNKINLVENESRYDFDQDKIDNFLGVSEKGISEKFTIDNSTHSLFGASKLAADIVAQEYGRYFGMNIGVFRGGCLTGPQHAGVELHGFLSYIIKCAIKKKQYTVFGYKGKQVRDQIHSSDVISAFASFINEPRQGEVYNIGGCKQNSASILEVIDMIRETSSRELLFDYLDSPRTGDHICYYSDMSKFKLHYPNWNLKYSLNDIILEIINMELKN